MDIGNFVTIRNFNTPQLMIVKINGDDVTCLWGNNESCGTVVLPKLILSVIEDDDDLVLTAENIHIG